ncbi:histidine kinase [Rufibacter immobilis]|uniref:Histidine kinase n=1 Tax=Rufibacter immobilis TaxID=1348778 RepID=A0A3M9MXB1_9BACT|nr:histidine kinase [Rufibacter immobilis]RNI30191.1 histidine kinase [Rufibacter immobilis]
MATYGLPQNKFLSFLRWFLLFALLAGIQVMLTCSACYSSLNAAWRNFLYSFSLFSMLWLGNGYLSNNLSILVPWTVNPWKRFIITLLLVLLYSALVVFLVNWFWFVLLPKQSFAVMASPKVRESMFMQMLITYIITMTIHAVAFLRGWRETAIQAERLQKEHALSKYEALKNQVNPHFLFNSLNALTSLVHPEPDLAVKFIKQLSEVYRYVLDSQHKEVVSLEEELNFTQRYAFLQQIRHGDGLQVSFPRDFPHGLHLPPLALQTLLENAIKHNRVLAQEPLRVTVRVADQTLLVENNVQPKPQHEPPSGLGLPNIKARYEMLTDRHLEILPTSTSFLVRLPLLTFQ